ncbi:MAG TPA: BlaI/MecI/CopY family transcriptional regulator, partial [Vicinamibacterales bacterium]|nr:BlaI/MecI/CopY family transcriptional regulator [Vicinamibacterales bacterium]
AIRARLIDPPSDSSVRVMLARLEKKGYLRHQQDGLRYVYSAKTSPAAARRSALQQYVQTFFGGSLRQMMTELVAEESWTEAELDSLQAEIERARVERPAGSVASTRARPRGCGISSRTRSPP